MFRQIPLVDLEAKLTSDKLTMLNFTGASCSGCKLLYPILEDLSQSMNDVCEIYKVDIDLDEYRDLAIRFMIMSLPTVLFFKKGKVVHQFADLYDKEKIKALIHKYK